MSIWHNLSDILRGYRYQTELFLQDDFSTGIAATGSVGTLGWNATGTIASVASSAQKIGAYTLSTGAVSGTIARLNWHTTNAIDPALTTDLTWRAEPNTVDANTLIHIGAQSSISVATPDHGIYFEKLDNDTNWFCITRAGGSETRTDSGVAIVADTLTNFTYRRSSRGVDFWIGNTCVATHTTTIPTVFISPILFIVNSAAASKSIDPDYFSIHIRGLARF